MVIVTHNMQQAARAADFTGFFLMGRLIEFNKTAIIFKTPRGKRPKITLPAGSDRDVKSGHRAIGSFKDALLIFGLLQRSSRGGETER